MDSPNTPIRLHIPVPTLSGLSFCETHVEGITQWARELPMANTGESARQLYQAVRELNQWETDPLLRFQMLEVIRPYVYSICTLLNKHFLQSSISLNEKQLKIANLSQAMQGHLATGYKMVVAHSLGTPLRDSAERPAKMVTLAIHRAIADTSQTILRAFQLYCQPPEHAWLEINQLYLLAEMHQLAGYKVGDRQTRFLSTSRIQDVFVRAHLLGAAKPNNLRQQDLADLYEASELWAEQVTLSAADDESALFIINLHRDRPAQYRQHLRDVQKPMFRSMNTSPLVQALKRWAANPSAASNAITVPGKLSDNLLSHAIQSWGIHWQRSFRRAPTEGQLRLCIGLSATHYYSAGQKDFERIMAGIKPLALSGDPISQPDGPRSKTPPSEDVWDNAFDAGGTLLAENKSLNLDVIEFINKHKGKEDDDNTLKYPSHLATLINTSPGGYCVHWQGDIPASIQAGELLGIQEKGVRHWSVGVIRWIRHMRDQGTQLGVELLAPRAEVGAARLLQKTGNNGPYMRALLLPAIKAIAQPATLLLPRIPFRTGNKVELLFPELQGRFQLTRSLTSTSGFSQFQFRQTGGGAVGLQTDPGLADDDFDSIWNKL